MLAGIRSGKTLAGVNEAIKIALVGWQTYGAPNKGCIVAPTYSMLRDVILPEFFKYCPKELLKNFNYSEMKAIMENGSEILFRTADEPDRLRGLDLHWFFSDESAITKPEAYKILLGRIAQKQGCGWCCTTPKGRNWIYTEIYQPYEKGNKDYDIIAFRSKDNPYFPREEIERLKVIYSSEFYAQELEAQFVQFTGLVYKDFNRQAYLLKEPTHPIKYHIAGIDIGYTNPTAILIIGVDHDSNHYVIKEFYQTELTNEEIAEVCVKLNKENRIDCFWCDPSEAAFIALLNQKGLPARAANNNLILGINKVTELFRNKKLFIFDSCVNLIRELESYRYQEAKQDKRSEIPIKLNDHTCDSLRYAIMGGLPRRKFVIK